MGLLSGLSNMGLGKLENADIYEEKDEKKEEEQVAKEPEFKEEDVLFDKSCTCPVCDKTFSYRAVKTGKARVIGSDPDLRPRYEKFEAAKYDVAVCTNCGYSVVTKFLAPLPQAQVKLVKDNICGKVRGIANKPVYSYDDAIQRYQLALASAIVKKGKDSEKAYTCLRMAWIIRSKKESLSEDTENYDAVINQLRADENEALKSAFDGFIAARQKESFPMCGMDESTVDYLLAVLSARFGHYDIAQKLIGSILVSKTANNRIKDKTRELKEQVKMEMNFNKNK